MCHLKLSSLINQKLVWFALSDKDNIDNWQRLRPTFNNRVISLSHELIILLFSLVGNVLFPTNDSLIIISYNNNNCPRIIHNFDLFLLPLTKPTYSVYVVSKALSPSRIYSEKWYALFMGYPSQTHLSSSDIKKMTERYHLMCNLSISMQKTSIHFDACSWIWGWASSELSIFNCKWKSKLGRGQLSERNWQILYIFK